MPPNKPMTSWHSEALSVEAAAQVACSCHGAADYVLCLVAGDQADLVAFVAHLKRILGDAA